jgi:hypothetical protein
MLRLSSGAWLMSDVACHLFLRMRRLLTQKCSCSRGGLQGPKYYNFTRAGPRTIWPNPGRAHCSPSDMLLSVRVILKLASRLSVCLFRRSKVERASVLLAVKKTSEEYIVSISSIILSVVNTIFMIEQLLFIFTFNVILVIIILLFL